MVKIALDAGHYINTPGKRCLKKLDPKETREWVLNSRVADLLEKELNNYTGYELIRLDDTTGKKEIKLAERAKKANNFKVDILISIHHNAGINGGSGGGIVVYRYPNSMKFTKTMQKKLYDALIKYTGLKGNRASPLAEANFQILRDTKMAAVLIENGFMDSKTDVPIILTKAHAEKTAKAILEFIVTQYKLKRKPEPKPSPIGKGYYRVVVGSYQDKTNAIKQQEKLKKAGFDSFLAYYE